MGTFEELVEHIQETIGVDKETSFLTTPWSIEEPIEKFLRQAEEHRRDRLRCIDAGDETARVKFEKFDDVIKPKPPPPQEDHRGSGGGYDRQRSGYSTQGSGGYSTHSRGDKRPQDSYAGAPPAKRSAYGAPPPATGSSAHSGTHSSAHSSSRGGSSYASGGGGSDRNRGHDRGGYDRQSGSGRSDRDRAAYDQSRSGGHGSDRSGGSRSGGHSSGHGSGHGSSHGSDRS